jgi:hypothetical protein
MSETKRKQLEFLAHIVAEWGKRIVAAREYSFDEVRKSVPHRRWIVSAHSPWISFVVFANVMHEFAPEELADDGSFAGLELHLRCTDRAIQDGWNKAVFDHVDAIASQLQNSFPSQYYPSASLRIADGLAGGHVLLFFGEWLDVSSAERVGLVKSLLDGMEKLIQLLDRSKVLATAVADANRRFGC